MSDATPSVDEGPNYKVDDFRLADDAPECDLVLKGGVTSGVIYPYAILEIAKKYRLRSIGGASAGAIAAGFAAAAEYARRNGDPGGFVRLGERCNALPDILFKLFQPTPTLRPLFDLAIAFTAKQGKGIKAIYAIKGALLLGAGLGAGIYAGFLALTAWLGSASIWSPLGLPGFLFAVLLGATAGGIRQLYSLAAVELPNSNFGMCSGLPVIGTTDPALTTWLHESLQYIAFGDASHERLLTFNDLAGADGAPHGVDLRAMTTNLSLRRPEVIPRTRLDLRFNEAEWLKLFPKPVVDHLLTKAIRGKAGQASAHDGDYPKLPDGAEWPVLVGVRMSLSFPGLIQAVPLYLEDIGAAVRNEAAALELRKIWFSDGGITSNFPIHFFDSLLPTRPTFALSLDDFEQTSDRLVKTQPPSAATNLERTGRGSIASASPGKLGRLPITEIDARISLPKRADEGVFLPIKEVSGLGGFASAILGSAKDWQDQAQSTLPGQRQRVVRIKLKKEEGGLNLKMDTSVSGNLMLFGWRAGQRVSTEFDFGEHRWRRALVAYEQLEALSTQLYKVWPDYGVWYRANYKSFSAYTHDRRFSEQDRLNIADRMDSFLMGAQAMRPEFPAAKFPRPTGRLRTVPEL